MTSKNIRFRLQLRIRIFDDPVKVFTTHDDSAATVDDVIVVAWKICDFKSLGSMPGSLWLFKLGGSRCTI